MTVNTQKEHSPKYIIAKGSNTHILASKVNKHIEDGYIPQGGVSSVKTNIGYEFTQALIKDNK